LRSFAPSFVNFAAPAGVFITKDTKSSDIGRELNCSIGIKSLESGVGDGDRTISDSLSSLDPRADFRGESQPDISQPSDEIVTIEKNAEGNVFQSSTH